MKETFCQACGLKFPVDELMDGTCAACIAKQKEPRPKRPVFSATDIEYTGRRHFPWVWVGLFGFVIVMALVYWPQKHRIDMNDAEEMSVTTVLENLSDNGNDVFVKSLMMESQRQILETFSMVETHIRSPHILATINGKEKGYYKYTVTVKSDIKDKENYIVRATPLSLFKRHYLMEAKGDVYYRDDEPATTSDSTLKRPKTKKMLKKSQKKASDRPKE